MRLKQLVLSALLLLQTGCASWAYRSYACQDQRDFSGIGHVFGLITQIGDCALFKNFKIETGTYYQNHSETIRYSIETVETMKSGVAEPIRNLSRSFNCKSESDSYFVVKLIENKNDIFGKKFENSSVFVTKAIQNMIDRDETLSQTCN